MIKPDKEFAEKTIAAKEKEFEEARIKRHFGNLRDQHCPRCGLKNCKRH